MPKTSKNIDLNFESDILTRNSAAIIVNAIFEMLLYQRNQIPFVFRTYDYFVSKWKENDANSSNSDVEDIENKIISNFNFYNQRKAAISTLKDITKIKEILLQAFKNYNDILSVRFLFGATPQMPKEIYHLKIPRFSDPIDDYQQNIENAVKEILKNFVTSENLYRIFSTNLCPTNIFLDIELKCGSAINECDNFTLSDLIEFQPSCKQIYLNLVNDSDRFANDVKISDSLNEEMNIRTESESGNFWMECNYNVKGFKENSKCLNLWRMDEN